MRSRLTIRALTLCLLPAAPLALAAGDPCLDQCWNTHRDHLAQCTSFSEATRQVCRAAALDSDRACLQACLSCPVPPVEPIRTPDPERLGAPTSLPLMSGMGEFSPGIPSLPTSVQYEFVNPGSAGTYFLTLLNDSGDPTHKLSHLKVTLNDAVVYDNWDFSKVVAVEILVTLDSVSNTVLLQTQGMSDGVVTAWIANGRVANVSDLNFARRNRDEH